MNFVNLYLFNEAQEDRNELFLESVNQRQTELQMIADAKKLAPIYTIKYNNGVDHYAHEAEEFWGFRFKKEELPYVNITVEDVLKCRRNEDPDGCLYAPYYPFGDCVPHHPEHFLYHAIRGEVMSEYELHQFFREMDISFRYPSLFVAMVSCFADEYVELVEQEYGVTLSNKTVCKKGTPHHHDRYTCMKREKTKLHAYHEKTGRYNPSSYNRKGYKKEYMKDSYKRGNRKVRKEFDLPSGKSGWKKLGSCTCVW